MNNHNTLKPGMTQIKSQQMKELALKHLFEKLYHHQNVVASEQADFPEEVAKDKQDVKELKLVYKWLFRLKV